MKKRLDQILVDKSLAESKTRAQALIMAGQVSVDGQISDKSGRMIAEDAEVTVRETFPYVSRGASKLEKAYTEFDLDFTDKTVCDIGSSTGGFTDFVLQHGATKVFAIDVGTGQLAQKIREDDRVVVMERTDFRDVTFSEPIDIFVCDVSFISLKKIIPKVAEIIRSTPVIPSETEESLSNIPEGSLSSSLSDEAHLRVDDQQGRDDNAGGPDIVLLIKPQFEAGAKEVTKGKGIIRNAALRTEIVEGIKAFAINEGFQVTGLVESPITGAKGNVEYLLYLQKVSPF